MVRASLAERLADRFTAPGDYGSLLQSLTPREAASALGLTLGQVTPHAVASAWRRGACRGVKGHAAKDVLLLGLRLAEDEAPEAETPPSYLTMADKTVEGVTLSEAMSAGDVPSGVDWKMQSTGKSQADYRTWILVVGQAGTKLLMAAFYFMPAHIRTPMREEAAKGAKPTKVMERWEAKMVLVPPGKDLVKAIKAAGDGLNVKMIDTWRVWPNYGLSEGVLKKMDGPVKGGVPLKEALLGSGLARLPDNRKTQPSVDLIFKKNRNKHVWDDIEDVNIPGNDEGGAHGNYDSIKSVLSNQDIYCRVDGKEYKLAPQTLADPAMRDLVRAVVKRHGGVPDGTVYNLTRSKTDRPQYTINRLLDALTNEPTGLIIALSRAAEFFDDKARGGKTAHTASPELAQLLSRFSARDVSALTGVPLTTLLSFEVAHVQA